ncbi:PH domain-containing protein [Microbacterium sp. NPDC089189]|uniref:PH domain-containing protein n=1 Tax=Microbacterium sp. NPDC089189 TaxID=3154972 RepID=UPI0034158AAA
MSQPDAEVVRSSLSDGEWHRLHPLTPLLRGGLFLVVVIGFVIANLRERLIEIFFPALDPGFSGEVPADPVEYVLSHDLILIALLVVLGALVLLIALFWASWRFHTFRITGDDVEVRSGVVFRTNRRAPLDRVQGVNLTRPLVARLVGLAKLEVVGAGLDANVRLEYLSTSNAEQVRGDILRLASGRTLGAAAAPAGPPVPWRQGAVGTVSRAVEGLVDGVEEPVAEPESVVRIPPGRVLGSLLLRDSTLYLLLGIAAMIVAASSGVAWVLFALVPTVLGFVTYTVRTAARSLRYAIAPTDHGVRIVFGLFTTVTETLPPGRVHAIQVRQPLLWRGPGWWTITVNRLSGTRSGQDATEAFTRVLPVGTRADAERVIGLLLPWLDDEERGLVFTEGLFAPDGAPGYTTTPARARLLRPLSWRRNGAALTATALFLRRGRLSRSVTIIPLARMQSVALHQGPLARRLDVADLRAHTVAGTVITGVGVLDRTFAQDLFAGAARGAVRTGATDRSHRWSVVDRAPEGEAFTPAAAEPAGPAAAPDVPADVQPGAHAPGVPADAAAEAPADTLPESPRKDDA